MNFKLVEYGHIVQNEAVFRVLSCMNVPLYILHDEDLAKADFICLDNKGNIFVSHIYKYSDNEHGRNSGYVVKNIERNFYIPVINLKELYLIEKS